MSGPEYRPAKAGRLLFLNRSYWPDTEATGQLLTTLCESLADRWNVEVVAGKPNVVAVSAESPMDWENVRSRNGVGISRVPHWTLPKRRLLFKALNYISFARATRTLLRRMERPDVVVFETDPFLLAFEADRLRERTGCRLVGYLQDIYPDVAVALKRIPDAWPVRRLRQRLFDVYRRCDRIIVLSADMRQLLLDGGLSGDRVEVIPNWADTQVIQPQSHNNEFRRRHNLLGQFVVMYSGNLGLTQRLEQFLAAAQLLTDQRQIQFVFVGNGSQRTQLERSARDRLLSNVQFLDYQPMSELSDSLSAANLHLIPLTAELNRCLMPSKLYGILAAGRPFLTNAMPETELHSIATQHLVGLTVPPDSPQAVADTIRNAAADPTTLDEMGQRARRLATEQYTRTRVIEQFHDMLTSVLDDSPAKGHRVNA
jgi:glycosyltransferase involved in cell wall biosynthesis